MHPMCSLPRMVRRLLPLLFAALSLHAQSRYVSDAAGAPVRWEGWGKRALERARKENRPIFLSIGYASSFECFRMQREAFLDGEVAQTLNTYFIPVLLDRLEYPEIAKALEAFAGLDGSPVLMILTPKLEPFAVSGPLKTGELQRMLVINANVWASGVVRASGAPPVPQGAPEARATPDVLGGGFHHAPGHFEKLLSDQALLAMSYLDAWQTTRDPETERIVRSTLDAALRDLRPPQSAGFQASQDAHSLVPAQGPEFWNGAFYVWEKDEVERLLGHDAASKVFRAFGMKDGVRNVLTVEDPVLVKDLAPQLAKMFQVRQTRPQPFREWNLISGSNGLMISALSRAGAVLGEPKYVDAATAAAQTVTKALWNAPKKTLLHSAGVDANADDYSLFIQGLLDLFEAGYDPKWLELARALQQRQDDLFWNESARRFVTGTSVPQPLRPYFVESDDETPGANAIAARNLLRMTMLTAHDVTTKVVVVVGDRRPPTLDALRAIHERKDPQRFVVFVPSKGTVRDRIVKALPFTAELPVDPEQPVVYECSGGTCRRR